MAPRDYKNRKKPAPKKKAPAPEPKKSKLGVIIALLLVLIIIGGFGYFLFSIKGSAPQAPEKTKVPASKPNQEKAIPAAPTEKWRYIKELEEKTVEVDVPEREDTGKRFQMQCGSFRKLEQAQSLKAQIAFAGKVAMVKTTKGKNGDWHRVILGPFDTKRQAEKDRHLLQNININGCKIWGWNWD